MIGFRKYLFLFIILAVIVLTLLLLGISFSRNDAKKSIQILPSSQTDTLEPNKEYVVLKINPKIGESVLLSDISLENNEGDKIRLPQASALPLQGVVNKTEEIKISRDINVIISSGQSPLGVSFRENKCTGYLGQFQNYYPPLEKECPAQIDTVTEHNIGLLPDCRAYVESLPMCETKLYDFPENVAPSCQVIVRSYIHYNACVEAHRDDSDFYLPIWRLYLNGAEEFWKNGDTIKILNENGELLNIHQLNS